MRLKAIQIMGLAGFTSAILNALGGLLHEFSLIAIGGILMIMANGYCVIEGGK